MSNNVLKSNFIQFTMEDAKVIDCNSLVAKRLEGFSGVLRERENEVEEGFISSETGEELNPHEIAELLADRDNLGEKEEITTPEEMEEYLAQMKADAEAQVEEIRTAARNDIDAYRNEVYSEAESKGYNDGRERAEKEANEIITQLEERREALESEYRQLALELEGKIVSAVSDIYRKVFGNSLFDKKDVMVTLVSKALFHVGNEENIVIHVSSEDYDELLSEKTALFSKVSYSKEPDIKSEEGLPSGAVKVETPYGIIDCGIETELTELMKTLSLLSNEGINS